MTVADVPRPLLRDPGILVQTSTSLISAGTERAALELGRKNLVGMARERPDLVQRVLEKLKRDGFWATLNSVRNQLDQDVSLGYSMCGRVLEVGSQAASFRPGQMVACAGAGYACHAEVNYVPSLLAAHVPSGVQTEAAAYSTVGAIALQGVRNADVRVGETVVVIGLGLVGQLTVQLLRAAGCRPIGFDLSPSRVELALKHGAEAAFLSSEGNAEAAVLDLTRGRGADAVLITAATKSNAPVELAAHVARDRARIVMVGATGMEIPRNEYYHKELSLVVSRSYGPGRYDPQYEELGRDYPAAYVRWTENRNIEAFLDLVADGRIDPTVCTTHRFSIENATDAMELILTNSEPHLGVLLTYPERDITQAVPENGRIATVVDGTPLSKGTVGTSFVGAGNFARAVLLPELRRLENVTFRGVTTSSGISARSAAKRFGFQYCCSSLDEVLTDDETNLVFITTRHSSHASLVQQALAKGKTVFVEKPLAVNLEQLAGLYKTAAENGSRLTVGFNRRFSRFAQEIKQFVDGAGPLMIQYRCNAGPLPEKHWLSDPAEGGRIVGEACHFFDLFAFLTGAAPVSVQAVGLSMASGCEDDAQITVQYADGSVCQLLYTSLGPPSLGKERIEVFAADRVAVLDDFRALELYRSGRRRSRKRSLGTEKGHASMLKQVVSAVQAGKCLPIPFESLVETTLTSFAAVESVRRCERVDIADMHELLTNPSQESRSN